MKRFRNTVCLLSLSLLLLASFVPAFGQGTAFTYQGRLNNTGVPANGTYDFLFLVFANAAGGVSIADAVLSNGLR